MKKLMLLLAGAMALSFTANAVALFSDNGKWFDGGIKEGWPTTAENGGWSNTNGTTYAESKLNVSALAETPLTFTADVAKVTADYTATISSTVGFTAFEELPDVPADAKAGVISYGGNFYAIAINEDGANAWKDTGITASDEATVDITFLDPTKVVYTIGGTLVTNTVAEAAQIQNVCITGNGTLAGLKATAEQKAVTFTIADADHTTKKVEGAELVEGTTYKALPRAEVIVTYTADFGYFFADGSKTYIVDVEAGQGIEIEVKVDRVVAAAKIGDDKDYFTLTNALAEAKSGDTVTLLKDAGLTEGLDIGDPEDWLFTLTLDLNGKTISTLYATTKAAYDAPINVFSNATLTITGNGTIAGWTGADAAALDGKSIIVVDDAKLKFENGTLTAGGIGSDGLYGVYVCNGGRAIIGTQDEQGQPAGGPTIKTWFAAVGSNNTTPGATGVQVIIYGGTYEQIADGTGQWWHYFCAPIYAPAAGTYSILGGSYTGALYAVSAPYANVGQAVNLSGGTFAMPLYVSETQATQGGGTRIVTKGEGVQIAAPAGYDWDENGILQRCEAKIGDVYYITLAKAIEAAQSKDVVELVTDVELDKGLDIGDPAGAAFILTLDLNGKTITAQYETTKKAYDPAINIYSNAIVTINGNGTIAGWEGQDAAALDGKSIIAVDGAQLYFENGTLTAGGIGSDGLYGVYAFNDSIVRLGIADDTTTGPTITTWFAAVGSNNTTAPCMITIWGGAYTQLAKPAEGDWWHYFCAPVYAAAAGGYTIKGGTFTGGLYSISAPYADAAQTIALDGGTFNQPLYASEKQGVGGGTRIVTKGEGVTIAAPAGYEWRDNVLWKLIAVESVTLDQTAVTTNIGETVQLTMTYAPEDADVVSTNWTSSAEMVAKVDQTGLVTAIAEGKATITVTVADKLGNEKSATCVFTVERIDPAKKEEIEYKTAEQAAAAAALINNNLQDTIKAPDALSEADKTIYRNMFQATADGTVVTIGLTETAEDAVQKDVNTNTVTKSVADALIEPTAEEVTIDANVPGIYYWIEGAEAVGFEMPTNGPAAMATAKGSLELVKPGKAGTGAQQFYKVAAGVKDPNPEPVKK